MDKGRPLNGVHLRPNTIDQDSEHMDKGQESGRKDKKRERTMDQTRITHLHKRTQ